MKNLRSMEDKAQTNQVQTASMNRTKAPQKVEVVVANPSSGSEVNILGELSIFVLRIGFCALMIHHGLEKLQDPQGFAEFVVGKYFPFLPGDPVIWTFGAAITQLVCPVGLALGIFARLSSLGLFSTMAFAVYFHLLDTGLEGFLWQWLKVIIMLSNCLLYMGLFLSSFYAQVQAGYLYSEKLIRLHIIQNLHNLM